MQSSLTTGEGLKRSLNITIPAKNVDAAIQHQLTRLSKTAKLDGFRPGKVPPAMLKQRLGAQLGQDVARDLVNDFLPKALEEHKLTIAGQPSISLPEGASFEAHEGKDFAFNADVEIYPEFTPKGWEKLELTQEKATADDALIDSALTRLQGQLSTFVAKEKGATALGDRVTLTGQGYVKKDGKEEAFAGGNLQGFKLVLGSGQTIPGFEDGLTGLKAGESTDLKVTFPKDYHAKDLAGQPAVFKVKVDAVEAPQQTELNDDEARKLGFADLAALREVLKKGAERDLSTSSQQRLKRQLLDMLDEANKGIALPQGMVQAEEIALWRAQLQELQQRGLPLEALGENPQAVRDGLKPLAERRVRLGLLLAKLAEEKGLQVTEQDLNQAISAQLQMAGPRQEQVREYFSNPQNRAQLRGPILEDKVTAWLLSNAKITEKNVDAKSLLTELE